MSRSAMLVCMLVGCGTPPPAVTVIAVDDLGVLPLPADGIGRDGGYAGELGGQLLWTFGDTFLTAPNHLDNSSVLSATSGWSTAASPLALVQSMNGAEPAQLIPYTADELAANQTDALNGYALWPGALVPIDDVYGIVAFQHVKRTAGSSFASDGIGLARVLTDAPIAERLPGLVFAAPETQFEPQFASGGFVYAWGCEQLGFLDFRCKLARVVPAGIADRTAWQFFDGASWQGDLARAAFVIDHAAGGPSISYNAHLGRYLAINCGVVSSTVLVRTADAIEGPWSEPVEIAAGSTGILAPTHGSDYNYICVEHPELSVGASVVISYSRPTEAFHGDVRLARITFE